MQVTTIGIDLGKHVFQVHGVDAKGKAVLRKRLRRGQVLPFFANIAPCLIGMEACGSAHHWARELMALGHEVKLMPPSYVKAYVKRGKNDAADAEATCEAVRRPSMRFVPVKSAEQQSVLMLHRSRDLLIRQRTMLVNALRAHLAELGIIAPQGITNVSRLAAIVANDGDERIPPLARRALSAILTQLRELGSRIKEVETEIVAWHRGNEASRRLATIPGVGPITASAIAATVTAPSAFCSGRHFAAWLGLVPRQNSSAGKDRLGGISKAGDRYIRRLLVIGATTVIRYARTKAAVDSEWIRQLLDRRPPRVASVALANKTARIAWAILTHGGVYCPAPARGLIRGGRPLP
ncbi:MAG: IS110 family transposase [Armatimonadota bacterium]